MLISQCDSRPAALIAALRRATGLAFFVITLVGLAAPAFAQRDRDFDDRDPPARRSNDDLYRSLLESETERRNLRRTEPRGTFPPARVIDQPTREMLQARKILDGLTRDADDLASLLNDEVRRIPELRATLTDVMRMRARINLISDRAQQQNDHAAIVEELRNLDRDWRLVAMRLMQTRGLSRRTTDLVEHINGDAKELSQILDIKPQMNRRELVRQTASIATDVGNLLEDADIELAREREHGAILAAGRRVRQQAIQVANTVDDQRDYELVLSEYKRFQSLWTPFASSLRPFQNRILDRHVRRIAEADAQVTELLWIPHQMDRQRLLYLTDSMKRDVDEFFSRTPLKLLIDLPDSRSALPVSNEFYGVVANFNDTVNSDDSDDQVISAFRYIEQSHRDFIRVFRDVNSQAALQVLKQIDQDVRDLREGLRLQDGHGGGRGGRAVDLAAKIDTLAEQVEYESKNWLDRSRSTFRSQALQEIAAFSTQARRLNESITQGDNQTQQARDISLLSESWRRVYNYIKQCDSDERPRLQQLSTEITPALVQLQTLIMP